MDTQWYIGFLSGYNQNHIDQRSILFDSSLPLRYTGCNIDLPVVRHYKPVSHMSLTGTYGQSLKNSLKLNILLILRYLLIYLSHEKLKSGLLKHETKNITTN